MNNYDRVTSVAYQLNIATIVFKLLSLDLVEMTANLPWLKLELIHKGRERERDTHTCSVLYSFAGGSYM